MMTKDIVSGVAGIGISVPAFLIAKTYSEANAGLFPETVSAVMFAASFLILARGAIAAHRERGGILDAARGVNLAELSRVGAAIVMSFVYIAGVAYAGFTTASLIFIPAVSFALGLRCWVVVFSTTIVFVSITTYAFVAIFNTPLPRDLLLSLILKI
jgi:putative tricarboxylic transport membrane protein